MAGCATSPRKHDFRAPEQPEATSIVNSRIAADPLSQSSAAKLLNRTDGSPAEAIDERNLRRREQITWRQFDASTETSVVAVTYNKQQTPPSRLPPSIVPELDTSRQQSGNAVDAQKIVDPHLALTLDEVLNSVYASYPLLRVAFEQRTIANGQLLEAHGEFDLKLKAGGTSGALGFYQTNRMGTGFEQALFSGGDVFAGYRIGRGNFQPWYGERETNDGGEFATGFLIPLLQNRSIDARRATIFRSALGRDAVEPDILQQLIEFVRVASYSYWDWVASGQVVAIEQSLLDIALQRQEGLRKRVEGGDLPRIDLTDNERLIASRRAAVIDAQRKFQQSTIKMSLFFRTPDGQPFLAPTVRLPGEFPVGQAYDDQQLAADIETALASRPETQFLEYVLEQLQIDLMQAQNMYLPDLSVGATASKDVGAAASSKGDKTPFELEASLLASMPLQRRKALGKLQATRGKRAQVLAKYQFARDKIATDVQNSVAALQAAHQRISQAQQSVELNLAMEAAERTRFDAGDSNLLIVNLREQASADARKTLVAAQLEYFLAEADYRTALATIPLADSEP